ncbi:MAG: YceD family protein [Candidatus Kryptoniota bacterium]
MKIHISNLVEGVHQYDFHEKASELGLDEHFRGQVVVKAELEKRRNQFFLRVKLETVGRFTCDRCADEFDMSLSNEYRMAYVFSRKDARGYDEDEIALIKESTNVLDISDDVRQFVMLSVPLKLLCKEECAGLCPTCGANLNYEECKCHKEAFDPGWEKLKTVVNNN